MDKIIENYINKKYKLIFKKIFDLHPDVYDIKIVASRDQETVTINTKMYENTFSVPILENTFKYKTVKIMRKMNKNSLHNLTLNKNKKTKKIPNTSECSIKNINTNSSKNISNNPTNPNIKKQKIQKKYEDNKKKKIEKNKKIKNIDIKTPILKKDKPNLETEIIGCSKCKVWERKYKKLEKKYKSLKEKTKNCYLCILKDNYNVKDYYLTAYNIYNNKGKKIYYNIEMNDGIEHCNEYSSDESSIKYDK